MKTSPKQPPTFGTQSPLSRRQFLRRAATAVALPMIVPGSVLGLNGAVAPSNRIVFGAIGVGGRARGIIPNFMAFKEIQFHAVCECRADRLASAKEMVDNHYGNKDCVAIHDFRDLLAREDIDAVLIATGNRWHGLGAIYAARAGKDIYCEKPVALTIAEGRAMVETTRRYGTIYQAGTQRRSTASYRFVVDMVKQGKIGQLHTVEMQVWAGLGVPNEKAIPVPDGWDYEMWLGQTPWQPFTNGRTTSWHYFWDMAEGMVTDMGCHYTDQMQCALVTDNTGPIEFEGRGEFPDPTKYCSDAPITAELRCKYANGVTGVMYQRGAFKDRYLRFIGDEGWIQIDDDTDIVTASPASILSLKAAGTAGWGDNSDHVRNLLDSIRSRQLTVCHPEIAHRALTICQAWNIGLRLGRKLKWDPVKEQFDLPEANRMLYREPRAPWIA